MDFDIIPLARIRVPSDRLRPIDGQAVLRLAASIKEQGLLQPITIRPVGRDFELVVGGHRLEAVRSIGSVDIAATVALLSDQEARLAEIDENLVRNDLTALERAEHLAERKRVYLLTHPETKQGTAGALASNAIQGKGDATATVAVASPAFATDTAATTGIAVRTIQQHVQIAESIPEDVRMQLHGTPMAASTTQLTALASLDHDEQREVIATTDLTDASAVKAAINTRRPPPKPKGAPAGKGKGRGRRQVRVLIPPRPEAVVRFISTVGALHRFVEIDPEDLRGHLTADEIAAYFAVMARLDAMRAALARVLDDAARAIG